MSTSGTAHPRHGDPGHGDPGHASHGSPDVIVCPGGPLLLRGEHVVADEDGTEHTTSRPISAVCRCGKSGTKPWCDGTHKVIPEKNRP